MADVTPGQHWGPVHVGLGLSFSQNAVEKNSSLVKIWGDFMKWQTEWDKDEEEMLHSSLSVIK